LTEIGSKWSKKKKRRSEVRENKSLDEKIRRTDQQGGWIVDNSTSRKIHQWMLWSTSREIWKDRLAKPEKRVKVDLGF
jgi:hypothetical protein